MGSGDVLVPGLTVLAQAVSSFMDVGLHAPSVPNLQWQFQSPEQGPMGVCVCVGGGGC